MIQIRSEGQTKDLGLNLMWIDGPAFLMRVTWRGWYYDLYARFSKWCGLDIFWDKFQDPWFPKGHPWKQLFRELWPLQERAPYRPIHFTRNEFTHTWTGPDGTSYSGPGDKSRRGL